ATLLAIAEPDLCLTEPTPGDRPVDRQALHPVGEQLPMPGGPKLHLVREMLQSLAEVALLRVPCVRGDELDRVQGPRTDRRLVLDRVDLVEGTANPELVNRLLPCGVDFQALQEAGRFRHPSRFVDRLERLQTQLTEHRE